MSRTATATRLGLIEQARRPLLLVLLVGLPFFFITRAIAQTEELPRTIALPGGDLITTTMREIHGADMAAITIAFLAGLCGVFVMQSVREADRRLIVAGFRTWEAVLPRLIVLCALVATVLVVSVAVTALSFSAEQWGWFAVGNLLVGVTFAALGALAGAVLGRLPATYLVLFGAMLDLGIAQNPMFGSGAPDGWAQLLPGYGAGRVIIDASFSSEFHAYGAAAVALAWSAAAVIALALVLRRAVRAAA